LPIIVSEPAICDTTLLGYRDAPGECLGARKVPVNDKTLAALRGVQTRQPRACPAAYRK
jgi:hypothetical protein